MASGLTTGFKKKCIYEVKAIKQLGQARALTEEEVRECNRAAAESVKERFEKSQVCLVLFEKSLETLYITFTNIVSDDNSCRCWARWKLKEPNSEVSCWKSWPRRSAD